MSNSTFNGVREQLRRAGVASKYVNRALLELESHYEELVDRATHSGLTKAEAETVAAERIGTAHSLLTGFLSRPELRCMTRRHPIIAHGLAPLMLVCLAGALVTAASLATGTLLMNSRSHSEAPILARLDRALHSAFLLGSSADFPMLEFEHHEPAR